MKNTGTRSEDLFDEAFTRVGKRAYLYKFIDTKEVRATTKKHITIRAQPSDRFLIYDGWAGFVEIKSSVEPNRFNFSLLRVKQSAEARMVLIAGGQYTVAFHHIPTDQWYWIPYRVIHETKEAGKSSIPLKNLESYKWTLPTILI